MTRIVTDSNSQIPPALVERYGITVVPLTVTVDGQPYAEGVDLDADEFWRRFEAGTPEVSTSQPSSGRFAAAYDRLVAEGADEILSIHIGASVSGTVNAARLAAADVAVPVRIVDTGTASFGVALCTWAAAEVVDAGGTMEDAVRAAEETAGGIGSVFVVRALDLPRAGGRLAAGTPSAVAIPVLTMAGGRMEVVGEAADERGVADVMAAHVRAWRQGDERLRVGVGVADAGVAHFWEALEERLGDVAEVGEIVRYRVGPSVGVHTGPGTVGAMYAPIVRSR
ncbi:MAG TPA: DegV family protein [Acidimicrobiales bacterium]